MEEIEYGKSKGLQIVDKELISIIKDAEKRLDEIKEEEDKIDETTYKYLKSYESENRILLAFGIAMFILIFSVYLSRKGYTSYTSWLEKLANDKLTFDLQLLQHIDREKLREYYYSTFELAKKDQRNVLEMVEDKHVLGWKPIDENAEWYSVFTEKMDYRFYEVFFGQIYSKWAEKNYYEKGKWGDEKQRNADAEAEEGSFEPEKPDPGEFYSNDDRPTPNLYTNPEMSPWKNNSQIKKELLEDEKIPHKGIGPIRLKKINQILQTIDIFKEVTKDYTKKDQAKVEKILIRKIQIDLLYYSVMINFRRGLVNATEKWMEADDTLKLLEKTETKEEATESDIGAEDLDKSIRGIIEGFACTMRRGVKINEEDQKKKRQEQLDRMKEKTYEKRREKIEAIKEKMNDRNTWNSDDWRAMGSIYYKWREAGRPEKLLYESLFSEGSRFQKKVEVDDDFEEEPAGETFSEKFWGWWNRNYKHIKIETDLDPTEEYWIKHRTIRAVNSLSKSFGYKVEEDTGNAVLFFGVVFGIIIAVALTNSLDIVIEAMQLPEDCVNCWHTDWEFLKLNIGIYQYVFILFLCFFPLGILFYHQGTILLSAKAAEQMTLGSNVLVFVNFIFILLQAIVVYFLASSIGDVNSFLSLLILLVTIDAIWVALFTANDMKDDVRDAPVFIEWIIFDLIIGLFAWIFMIHYASVPPILEEDGWGANLPIFLMLLAVLSTRAIVDYSYGWKNFWSKFASSE